MTRAKVVSFAEYLKKHERSRLPLLAEAEPPLALPPLRPLDDRKIAHRRVMLRHLISSR
jgi:hypothetical protein